MAVALVAPDTDETLAQLLDWGRTRRGVATIFAPPVSPRPWAVARRLLRALGKQVEGEPTGQRTLREVHLAIAWCRALGVESVMVVHAQWLPSETREALDQVAESRPTLVYITTRPVHVERDVTDASWPAFCDAVARRPGVSESRRDALVPILGPCGPTALVRPSVRVDAAQEAYLRTTARLLPGPSPAEVARAVRQTLRGAPADRPNDQLQGVAASLEEIGYRLELGRTTAAGTWDDVARLVDPAPGAALALYAAGLTTHGMARLVLDSVGSSGASVMDGGQRRLVPEPGRPFVQALRDLQVLRAAECSGYLFGDMRPVDIRRSLVSALAAANVVLGAEDFEKQLSPSQAWLAERGVRVVRTAEAGEIETRRTPLPTPAADPRCRHGLRLDMEVEGFLLSHSRRLCAAESIQETRRAGCTFRKIAEDARVTAWRATQDGEDAGTLWRVASDCGVLWLQCMLPGLPEVDSVRDTVLDNQRRRPVKSRARAKFVV